MTFLFDMPDITTDRLVLRKLTYNDVDDVYAYGIMPEVSRYCIWETHRSKENAITFIRSVQEKYAKNEPADWAIYHKEDKKVIGAIGYVWSAPEHMKCEVGYALSCRYWNKGYATEALKAFIRYNFEQACIHRIEARCNQENVGSYRVMEKAGMQFEGLHKDQLFVKGNFWTMRQYAILNSK
jgi:ribosomal-protein-alanine N-acetyltransferase